MSVDPASSTSSPLFSSLLLPLSLSPMGSRRAEQRMCADGGWRERSGEAVAREAGRAAAIRCWCQSPQRRCTSPWTCRHRRHCLRRRRRSRWGSGSRPWWGRRRDLAAVCIHFGSLATVCIHSLFSFCSPCNSSCLLFSLISHSSLLQSVSVSSIYCWPTSWVAIISSEFLNFSARKERYISNECAALFLCWRFHGRKLAETPFAGTLPAYQEQGMMCRLVICQGC